MNIYFQNNVLPFFSVVISTLSVISVLIAMSNRALKYKSCEYLNKTIQLTFLINE